MHKKKEYRIKMRNGLELRIKKHVFKNNGSSYLEHAYFLAGNQITKFVRATIKELASTIGIPPLKMGYFLGYDIDNQFVRGHLEGRLA